MLPKIEDTFVNSEGRVYAISTMGDTTHVMVNHFCYHIAQMQEGELKTACQTLLQASKVLGQC
jgi:hypothetical protein